MVEGTVKSVLAAYEGVVTFRGKTLDAPVRAFAVRFCIKNNPPTLSPKTGHSHPLWLSHTSQCRDEGSVD